MTIDDDDRSGAERQTPINGTKRRKRIAIGAAGLAAVLGAGAYGIAETRSDKSTNVAEMRRATPQESVAASAPPASSGTSMASADSVPAPAALKTSVSSSPSPLSKEVREKIEEARRNQREHGVDIKRALPAPNKPVQEVSQTQSGDTKHGVLRVIAARGDLTGQRELALVAGGVSRYRGVECSQTFRFSSSNPKPTKKPNLLMCWRTTAQKSVIAVVVDVAGNPSKDKAVQALTNKWVSMG